MNVLLSLSAVLSIMSFLMGLRLIYQMTLNGSSCNIKDNVYDRCQVSLMHTPYK